MIVTPPPPRELTPNVWWIGSCLEQHPREAGLHACNSVYVVRGKRGAVLIEAGAPWDYPGIQSRLDAVLGSETPLLSIWITHQETPHAGGVGHLLSRYPEATLRGDVRDLHLTFPYFEDRFEPLAIGESIDLGDTEIVAIEAVIRDLWSTQWAFEPAGRVLFPGDGFAYSHHHRANECGCVVEELPELPIEEYAGIFAERSLYWTKFVDIEPYVRRLELLVQELDIDIAAPTHGLPITDVGKVLPRLVDGLRLGGGAKGSSAPRSSPPTIDLGS